MKMSGNGTLRRIEVYTGGCSGEAFSFARSAPYYVGMVFQAFLLTSDD
jgi:hypothetical protein